MTDAKEETPTKEEVAATKKKVADEKKAATAVKKAEREAKRITAAEEKKAAREAARMPENNGIRRPKPDTACGKIWATSDELSRQIGGPVSIKKLLENISDINPHTVKTQYVRWRKFNGVSGRVTEAKTEKAA